jgi:hypothetical protein
MPKSAAGFTSFGKQHPRSVSQNEPGHCMRVVYETTYSEFIVTINYSGN